MLDAECWCVLVTTVVIKTSLEHPPSTNRQISGYLRYPENVTDNNVTNNRSGFQLMVL